MSYNKKGAQKYIIPILVACLLLVPFAVPLVSAVLDDSKPYLFMLLCGMG